jgi:hypothetical protein
MLLLHAYKKSRARKRATSVEAPNLTPLSRSCFSGTPIILC